MGEIAELIERVEKLTGPDREVDMRIWFAFECQPIPAEGLDMSWALDDAPRAMPGERWTHHRDGIPTDGTLSPEYTASLDAAVGLVEKVLPGWSWESRSSGTGDKGQATVWNPSKAPGHDDEQRAYGRSTPAIALVLATLRALAHSAAPRPLLDRSKEERG